MKSLVLQLLIVVVFIGSLTWASIHDIEDKTKAATWNSDCRAHGGVPLKTADDQMLCLKRGAI